MSRYRYLPWAGCLTVVFTLLTGCGPSLNSVSGTVTFEGIEVAMDPRPTINFQPLAGDDAPVQGVAGEIQEDGSFVLLSKNDEGARSGDYEVTIAVWGKVGRKNWAYPGPQIPVEVEPSTVTVKEDQTIDFVVKLRKTP